MKAPEQKRPWWWVMVEWLSRIHLEHAYGVVLGTLSLATAVLSLAGFFTDSRSLMLWGLYSLVMMLGVACRPFVAIAAIFAIDRFRGRR